MTIVVPAPINGTQGRQVAYGAGTVTAVANEMPVASNPGNAIPPVGSGPLFTGSFTGTAPIDISLYDSPANQPGTLANPGTLLATVKSANGYAPASLNVSFTHGLFVIQRSPSTVVITD
ncbi:hypothetical protein [Paraburkholderia caffeinilytica]|uniref:hypothetical protein n=1 Tax=Paraburkholderia caffeinilytica TaxID=1761016 RepID=UPI0038B98A4A